MQITDIEIHSFKGLRSVGLSDCGRVNALVGKNNTGKSSILHAIDMVGLALEINSWSNFQPKLEIKDLFSRIGNFSITVKYEDGSQVIVTASPQYGPVKEPQAPADEQRFKSILIWPDVTTGMRQRRHKTPRSIVNYVEQRRFDQVDSLEILYAIKYYGDHLQRGMTSQDYREIVREIEHYFPDITSVESDRTEEDIATLTYTEYGSTLDILYSGSGLKHFIDVLVKTVVSKADVVLLDEPEMGLHPDLQRQFIEYLHKLCEREGIQVFMATHSPVLLNYADVVTYHRVVNREGDRSVLPVPGEAIHTLLSDLGIRPSDVFNQDICLMVEGASEVVFFEHVIRTLYEDAFANIGIAVLQYAGSAADGIISGHIDVSNIVPAQEYTYWIRDREKPPSGPPSSNATKFRNALDGQGLTCRILKKREIEYYYPESVLVAAQQGDKQKEEAVRQILQGDQSVKFRRAARPHEICVPSGKYLRRLLHKHLAEKSQLDQEIRDIVEDTLIPWKNQILGTV